MGSGDYCGPDTGLIWIPDGKHRMSEMKNNGQVVSRTNERPKFSSWDAHWVIIRIVKNKCMPRPNIKQCKEKGKQRIVKEPERKYRLPTERRDGWRRKRRRRRRRKKMPFSPWPRHWLEDSTKDLQKSLRRMTCSLEMSTKLNQRSLFKSGLWYSRQKGASFVPGWLYWIDDKTGQPETSLSPGQLLF